MSGNARILLVDDFASMRKIVHNLLADLGYSNVVEASGAADALRIAQSDTPDLIITDWNMPSMTGLELLRQVRSSPRCGTVPVLMITAQAQRDQIQAAAEAGVSDYLIKPFKASTFKRKLDGALGLNPASDAPAGDDDRGGEAHIADPATLAGFVDESRGQLRRLDFGLAACAPDVPDPAFAAGALRTFHSIKGSAGFLGLDAMAHLCHAAESVLDRGITPSRAQALGAILAALDACLDDVARQARGPAGPGSLDAVRSAREAAADASPRPASKLRVDLRQIEHLSGLVDALAAPCHQAADAAAPAAAQCAELPAEFRRTLDLLAQATASLRYATAGELFRPLRELATHLARQLGKQVEVSTSGDAIELERALAEDLTRALNHLMRNALDHGIESPAERQRVGKPACGGVQLNACAGDGGITIELRDDGAGIDPAAVKDKAVARGLLTATDAAMLSDADALALVFRSGLSLRETVTRLSGRGIGLDIVRRAVATVGGRVDVSSTPGSGSTFSLFLPTSSRQARSVS